MRLPRRLLLRRLEQGGQPATTKKRVLFLLFVLALAAVFSTVYLLLATTGSRLVLEREYPLEARGLRQPVPVLPPSQVIPEVVAVDPPPITGPLLVTAHDPEPLELLQGSSIRIADTAVAAPMPKVVAVAATASAAAPAPPAPLLVIGIPTLRREGDPMYVVKTLEYLLNQTLGGLQGLQQGLGAGSDILGPYPLRVRVLVMDNTRAPGTHAAFEACISQFLTQGVAAGVLAPRVTHSIPHPKDPTTLYTVDTSPSSLLAFAYNTRPRVEDGNDPGSDNVPGFRVRAQTRDVGDLLLLANALYGSGGGGGGGSGGGRMTAYMFLEDDFRVCPQGLASLALAMGVATLESTSGLPESGVRPWNAIRVSYGLNGGVLRGEDVGTLGEYLLQHTGRRPPDHMWVEWFAGETAQSAATKAGRPHVAFRYNLLEHFGFSSSLRAKASPLYAMCYQELNENVVFEVEAFKARACGHDVIWPCWHPGDPRYANLTPSGIDFETLAKEAAKDTVQTAPRYLPPPRAPALRTALAADVPLSVHALTIPAYGHYQTTKGILLALAARGHNVTLLGCESTGKDVRDDGLEGPLGEHGGAIHFVSLGVCPSYTRREGALAQLVAGSPMPALEGIRDLSQDMCTAAMEYYRGDPQGRLPRVFVFDADTYCAMDLSVAWKVPRVARVGTGPRDAYTTSIHIPMFSSGLPLHMTLPQRLVNWATRALSRHVIGPLLLPWLYSGHRAAWAASVGSTEIKQQLENEAAETMDAGAPPHPTLLLPAGGGYTHNESTMPSDLPWDGVPTLFNTHWGLEHARPLAPYEHLIGHTNDFEGDARKALPQGVGEWIAATASGTADGGGAAPVVYVGMGTLSILPPTTLAAFAAALMQAPGARFIWSVPASQHAFLPPLLRLSSLRSLCAFSQGEGRGRGRGREGAMGEPAAASSHSPACQEAAREGVVMGATDRQEGVRPGSVLLLPWAPQLALLVEEGVRVFATHGGMNGIAEGLYARTPLLCIPLFSDQPDNCARAKDKGYAQVLRLSPTLTPKDLWEALHPLLDPFNNASLTLALQEAWVRNVGAGGAARAVGVIEETAALPYGAHLAATVPREYFMPWYQRWGVDIVGVVALGVGVGVGACGLACRACRFACSRWVCSRGRGGKDGEGGGEDKVKHE